MECEWVIKPEDALTILLFSSSFDLEDRVGLFLDLGLDLVAVVEWLLEELSTLDLLRADFRELLWACDTSSIGKGSCVDLVMVLPVWGRSYPRYMHYVRPLVIRHSKPTVNKLFS